MPEPEPIPNPARSEVAVRERNNQILSDLEIRFNILSSLESRCCSSFFNFLIYQICFFSNLNFPRDLKTRTWKLFADWGNLFVLLFES